MVRHPLIRLVAGPAPVVQGPGRPSRSGGPFAGRPQSPRRGLWASWLALALRLRRNPARSRCACPAQVPPRWVGRVAGPATLGLVLIQAATVPAVAMSAAMLRRAQTGEQPGAQAELGAGLEQAMPALRQEPDYSEVPGGGIQFRREIVFATPWQRDVNGVRISMGAGARVFANTKFAGRSVTVGKDAAVGGMIIDSSIGDESRVHRVDSVIKQSHLGRGVHTNGADLTNTVVGDGAEIGQSVVRDSVVGHGAVIGHGARLVAAIAGDGVSVADSAEIANATLVRFEQSGGPPVKASLDRGAILRWSGVQGATIGPYSHMRKDVAAGRAVTVGNFVEIKGSHIGDGGPSANAEIPHVSYPSNAVMAVLRSNDLEEYRRLSIALLTGTVIQDALEGPAAPVSESGTLRRVVVRAVKTPWTNENEEVTILMQRINWGGFGVVSDYDPLTGTKWEIVIRPGGFSGVHATFKAPLIFADQAGIANLSQAELGDVAVPGTIVIGVMKGGGEKRVLAGYRVGKGGRLKPYRLGADLGQAIDLQMEIFRHRAAAVQVLLEAARLTTIPTALFGYAARIGANQRQFQDVSGRFGKVVGAAVDESLQGLREDAEGIQGRLDAVGAPLSEREGADESAGRRRALERTQQSLRKRIADHEAVVARRDQLTQELAAIAGIINDAEQTVAQYGTVPYAQEVYRAQIADAGYQWVNPLAAAAVAGLEQVEAMDLEAFRTQHPDLVPADAQGLLKLPEGFTVHATPLADLAVRALVARAWDSTEFRDLDVTVEGLPGITTGSLVVGETIGDRPTDLPEGAIYLSLQDEPAIQGMPDLLQRWLTALGRPVLAVLGAVRLGGGRTGIFV